MRSLRTTTRGYDATGAGNGRLIRIVILWKLLGIGGLARNARIDHLARLGARHRLGRAYAIITVKQERRWRTVLRAFRQRRAILTRRAGLVRDKLLGRL